VTIGRLIPRTRFSTICCRARINKCLLIVGNFSDPSGRALYKKFGGLANSDARNPSDNLTRNLCDADSSTVAQIWTLVSGNDLKRKPGLTE
jgi:hypothetical protein